MKERPILFNGEMVRAILEGRKTQTRRVVRKQPPEGMRITDCHWSKTGWAFSYNDQPGCNCIEGASLNPYGWTGDRLWVRETWSQDANTMYPCPKVWYRASEGLYFDEKPHSHIAGCKGNNGDCLACWEDCHGPFRWRPSIHMPRWASRLTLEITDVRAERLQEISEEDAEAEGVDFMRHYPDSDPTFKAEHLFSGLWDSISKPEHSWEANPWVWVIEFKHATL